MPHDQPLDPAHEMAMVIAGVKSMRGRASRRVVIETILWIGALAIAFAIDRPVTQYLHDSGFAARFKVSLLAEILKAPGDFWFTLILAAFFWMLHSWRWKAAGLLCLTGLVSGFNGLVKWCVGRIRPFKVPGHPNQLLPLAFFPFRDHLPGLFHESNLCFASGHATLAFATAALCALLIPRFRWLFYVLACLVGLERILEIAHYPSDVVAGALIGIVGARIVYFICSQLSGGSPATLNVDAAIAGK